MDPSLPIKDTFSAVITEAKAVDANAAATQAEVDAAKTALDAAATAFSAAQKNGTSVRATLAEAISAAQGVHDAAAEAADGSAVSNAATWVFTADKTAFAAAIATATTVKDNGSATNEELADALEDLATASSAFATAQKPGYMAVSGGGLTITPIYRGFQVEFADTGSAWSKFILCDGAPVSSCYTNIKYIFQGSKFDSGSHIFYWQESGSMNPQSGTPLTVHAVDVTGGTGTNDANLYHTNIDSVNFAFNATTASWQLTRVAEPVKNSTLLGSSGTANSRIQSYGYSVGYGMSNYSMGSSSSILTWTQNAIDIWSWLYGNETAFSYLVAYYAYGGNYIVYAGNTEHQSYPAVQRIQAKGTSTLDLGNYQSSIDIGLFKDSSCTQAIDSDGWVSTMSNNSGDWSVQALRSNPDVAAGQTVYFGLILQGNSGSKTIPVSGKRLTIEEGTYYYEGIDLGTVTGSYP